MKLPDSKTNPVKIDLESNRSSKPGFMGFLETAMRKFRVAVHLFSLAPIYAIAGLVLGLSAAPSLYVFRNVKYFARSWPDPIYTVALTVTLALCYFLYGFILIHVVPAANFLLRAKLSPWRGPYYSLESLKWYIHNGLTYLVRFTFLEFITPTPFNVWFFRLMGMQLGKGVQINSAHISDPSLISIGEKTTIGGSATIVGHYGQKGLLILAPVVIGARCTIGLKATIMGGVRIEDDAKIMPHSVLLPKTVVGQGETWGGVPAQKIANSALPDSAKLVS